VIFDGNGLVPINDYNGSRSQCTDIPIFEYLGAEKKNLFHTQLMIGVMFGFMMRCRIPILLTIINFIIRSGGSFKPKIVPMFIDNARTTAQAAYGSSYQFLKNNRRRQKWEEMAYSERRDEDYSSSDDEAETDAQTQSDELPVDLSGDLTEHSGVLYGSTDDAIEVVPIQSDFVQESAGKFLYE